MNSERNDRMTYITTGDCVACGACSSICPRNCIELKQNESGFYMPFIDSASCIGCGKCRKVCPVNQRPEGNLWEHGDYYAMWANDSVQRKEGSSGGVFGMLADNILAAGGVVFGAAYSDDRRSVRQTDTDTVPLSCLKKSKYTESYTGTVFADVKKALDSGRQVLYCGTACQIDGLKSFLKNPYDNLLTCDFLCHGVPAAGVFEKYISNLEETYGKVKDVDFRSKAFGWKSYCSKVTFASGKVYLRTLYSDPYLRIFFENTAHREACYSCTRLQCSNADLTLGDFWRVKDAGNVPDTNEGISLVGVHTGKGQQALDLLSRQERCYIQPLTKEQYAYAYQTRLHKPQDREIKLTRIRNCGNLFHAPVSGKTRVKAVMYHGRALLQKARLAGKK